MRRQLLVFLLFSAAALAEVTIEGDAARKTTGEPLPGVRVAAQCGQTFWAATDAAGHFRFTGLPAASCGLSLDGPGLLPRMQRVTINAQDTHITLRVAMTPQAAIAGKVVDENGWPVARPFVTAAQYRTDNGVRQLQRVRTVQANDLGAYRIGKLPPGRYYIRVRPLGGVPIAFAGPVSSPPAPSSCPLLEWCRSASCPVRPHGSHAGRHERRWLPAWRPRTATPVHHPFTRAARSG